ALMDEDERVGQFVRRTARRNRLEHSDSHHPDQFRVLDEHCVPRCRLQLLCHGAHLLCRCDHATCASDSCCTSCTSSSIFTFLLTSNPPVSSAMFQVSPPSSRSIPFVPERPARP